jgi:hypothetical protein
MSEASFCNRSARLAEEAEGPGGLNKQTHENRIWNSGRHQGGLFICTSASPGWNFGEVQLPTKNVIKINSIKARPVNPPG